MSQSNTRYHLDQVHDCFYPHWSRTYIFSLVTANFISSPSNIIPVKIPFYSLEFNQLQWLSTTKWLKLFLIKLSPCFLKNSLQDLTHTLPHISSNVDLWWAHCNIATYHMPMAGYATHHESGSYPLVSHRCVWRWFSHNVSISHDLVAKEKLGPISFSRSSSTIAPKFCWNTETLIPPFNP